MLLSDDLGRILTHRDGGGCACPNCRGIRPEPPKDDGGDGGRRDGGVISGETPYALENAEFSGLSTGAGNYEYQLQQATAGSVPIDSNLGDADQAIDGLVSGLVWEQTALTYSFPTSQADYEADYFNTAALETISGFSEIQKNVSRDAFAQIEAFSSLTFVELGDDAGERAIDADLRLARSDDPSTAYAYFPFDNPIGGDAMFDTASFNSPQIGNYQYYTFLHEIGHTLGLRHGHETGGPGAIPFEMDSMEFSVMTYRSWVGKPLTYGTANETWGYAQSLMMLDIAAIQRLYGANFNSNSGDTTYTFSTSTGEMFVDGVGAGTPGGNRIFRTIWDGNGVDTYDFSNYVTSLEVDLAPGGYVDLDANGNFQRAQLEFGFQGNPVTYSRGHIFNALQYEGDERSLIENAVGGSGNDFFRGNAADNTFTGNQGNDTFFGSDGSDTYFGGAGTDVLVLENTFATYTFSLLDNFLQIADSFVDLVEDTIESIEFADVTRTFNDIVSSLLPQNVAPDAIDDAASTNEGAAVTIDVLANDSDADGDGLSVSGFTQGTNGSVSLNANGTLLYTPNSGFSGTDSFSYVASDGELTDAATVSILVNPVAPVDPVDPVDPVGTAPTAEIGLFNADDDRLIQILQDGDVIESSALPGQNLTIVALVPDGSAIAGAVESVRLNLNNQTFKTESIEPYALFGDNSGDFRSGNIPFGDNAIKLEFFDRDGAGGQLLETIEANFTIVPETVSNAAPVAADDTFTADAGVSVVGNVLADNGAGADLDPDGDALVVSPGNSTVDNGTLALNPDGSFTYTPNAGFSGTDSFSYVVSDGDLTDEATVDILINPPSPSSATPVAEIGLFNADDDRLIQILQDGDVIESSALPGQNLTIVALVPDGSAIAGAVESVRLNLNNQTFKTESIEPYALFGDNSGDFRGGSIPFGDNAIKLEFFDRDGAGGQLLETIEANFTIV